MPPSTMATPEEIHAYLVNQLGSALRRPGMMGNELTIRMLFEHLLMVEREGEGWALMEEQLRQRNAWGP